MIAVARLGIRVIALLPLGSQVADTTRPYRIAVEGAARDFAAPSLSVRIRSDDEIVVIDRCRFTVGYVYVGGRVPVAPRAAPTQMKVPNGGEGLQNRAKSWRFPGKMQEKLVDRYRNVIRHRSDNRPQYSPQMRLTLRPAHRIARICPG
jgi:hypothetical protein